MSISADDPATLARIAKQNRLYSEGKISPEEYEARCEAILAEPQGASQAAGEDSRTNAGYSATLRGLLPLVGINFILNVITLGIYRFWGITRLRSHIWNRITFLDDEFEYTGRPLELLIGWSQAFLVLIPVVASFYFLMFQAGIQNWIVLTIAQVGYALLAYYLIQVALFRVRYYRLTRTRWRGIRAGQSGSSLLYAALALGTGIVVVLTLGLAYPWRNVLLYRYKFDNTWFGGNKFVFDGRPGALFGTWVVCWLFMPLTLGFTYFWYRAAEYRYFASGTSYGNLHFQSNISGWQVFSVYFVFGLVLAAFLTAANNLLVFGFGTNLGMSTDTTAVDAEKALAMALNLGSGDSSLVWFVIVIAGLGAIHQLFFVHPLGKKIVTNLWIYGEEDFEAVAFRPPEEPHFDDTEDYEYDLGELR